MSTRSLRITLTALTVAGLGIAGYLTYVHYAGIKPVCTPGGAVRRCRPRCTPSLQACRSP